VILLDASALIAFLYGEPAEGEVAALLRSGECATPSPCLAEVVDQLIRRNGVKPEEVVVRLDPLIDSALGIVPVDNELAWQAGELRAVHYVRKGSDLSLADCLLLACVGPDDKLASSDRALLAAARDLELGVIALPDSGGHRAAG
jgi:PIN domain nuclease of toxin-antitoxin system